MSNFYTAKKVINGTEYTAQFNGISAALRAIDDTYIDGTSNTSSEKIAKYLFDNVLIEPKIDINDFGKEHLHETKTKEINGVEYTVRFNGILAALKAIDNTYVDGGTNTSTEKLTRYLLDEVIVMPEYLSFDDFASMDDFNEVIAFAREAMQGWGAMRQFNEVLAFLREVMQGNFRNDEKAKPKSIKEKSKE
jgi:hypothetical protein